MGVGWGVASDWQTQGARRYGRKRYGRRGDSKEDCEFGCTLRNLTTFLPDLLLFKDFAAEHSEAKSHISPFDWKMTMGFWVSHVESRRYGLRKLRVPVTLCGNLSLTTIVVYSVILIHFISALHFLMRRRRVRRVVSSSFPGICSATVVLFDFP